MQQRVEPTEQPGSGPVLRHVSSSQVNQTTWALHQVGSGRPQSATRVAKGDTGPLGQVSSIGGAVTGQEAPGQPG